MTDVTLNPKEIAHINACYNNDCSADLTDKLYLKPMIYISDKDIYSVCYAYDNIPFANTKPNDWLIEREYGMAKISHKDTQFYYKLDLYNGNVNLFNMGKPITIGVQVNVIQVYYLKCYAFPRYFHPKHPANGKTPFDLGIAIPDPDILNDLLNHKYNKDKTEIQHWYFDKKLNNINLEDLETYTKVINDLCQEMRVDIYKIL